MRMQSSAAVALERKFTSIVTSDSRLSAFSSRRQIRVEVSDGSNRGQIELTALRETSRRSRRPEIGGRWRVNGAVEVPGRHPELTG